MVRNLCLILMAAVVLFTALPAAAIPNDRVSVDLWNYVEGVVVAVLEIFAPSVDGDEIPRGADPQGDEHGPFIDPHGIPDSDPEPEGNGEWGAAIEPHGFLDSAPEPEGDEHGNVIEPFG